MAHLCPRNGDRLIPALTCGEQEIQKVPAIMPDGKTGAPCGACRQVMLETEHRYGGKMEVLLYGEEEIYVFESAADLLPLIFVSENLNG